MTELKNKIFEYHANLVNEIDILCEKAILLYKDEDIVDQINAYRDKLITKIKQVEKIKLENEKELKSFYDGIITFFISKNHRLNLDTESLDFYSENDTEPESNENSDNGLDEKPNDEFDKLHERKKKIESINNLLSFNIDLDGRKFQFSKHLGQLVIGNSLNNELINKFIEENYDIDVNCDFLEDSAKFQVYVQLIISKYDQVIIDLTKKENNQLNKLEISGQNVFTYEDIVLFMSGYEKLPTFLDVDSVKELKIKHFDDIKLLKQLWRPFKNLTKLYLNLDELNCKENTFVGLESIETLELSKMSIEIEKNAFKPLVNLKMLILKETNLDKFHRLNGLESLKKLKIINCSFDNFQFDYFESFKGLEYLQLIDNEFDQIGAKPLIVMENLKVLESNSKYALKIKSNLEILSLDYQKFNPIMPFDALKFLNIRREFPLNEIKFLNCLANLEFLDIKLPNKLTRDFNQVNLPKLKYLALTCTNTPNFNQSMKNLQGLELIEPKFIPRDEFVNLTSLDYLVITDPQASMFDKFCNTTFDAIKKLKFLRIEASDSELVYEKDEKNRINEALFKLFDSPDKVNYFSEDESLIEISAMFGEEPINEKVYFEKHLQVSHCVREFVLNNETNYYRNYLRDSSRRETNFYLDEETDSEKESNYDDYGYCGGFDGYDSDDKYMMGFGTYGTSWNEWCE